MSKSTNAPVQYDPTPKAADCRGWCERHRAIEGLCSTEVIRVPSKNEIEVDAVVGSEDASQIPLEIWVSAFDFERSLTLDDAVFLVDLLNSGSVIETLLAIAQTVKKVQAS